MISHFASPERATGQEIRNAIEIVSKNPVMDALMKTVSGLLAVLNEHRQILAVNETLLETLGVDDAETILGLRPGEAIQCIHAHDLPGGCGTSKFCSTCGAAIAIVSSLGSLQPVERNCVATVKRNNKKVDLYLRVRSCPIVLGEQRFIMLFLWDNTLYQRRSALERVFFHDIGNIIGALQGAAQLMDLEDEQGVRELAGNIKQLVSRLIKEVMIQRVLCEEELSGCSLSLQSVPIEQVIQEVREAFATHPTARNKLLSLPKEIPRRYVNSDLSLQVRILSNMLINAFEATDEGGEVKLWIEQEDDCVTFCVWNDKAIPEDIQPRIFQRNFSTKQEEGRGLGTFSMKLFGENYLGGKVGFTSSEVHGTVFRLHLPMVPA